MKSRVRFTFFYACTWVLVFQAHRLLFIGYNFIPDHRLPVSLITGSLFHGLLMDVSAAGYLTVLPALLLAGTGGDWSWYRRFLAWYTPLTVFITSLIVVADLELYRSWLHRLPGATIFSNPVENTLPISRSTTVSAG